LGGEDRLPEDTRLWDAAVARFPLPSGVQVSWQTDIPRSAGLSGSTALLAATLACVLKVRGEEANLLSTDARITFAELVRDIEVFEAGVKAGYQDAYMISLGGLRKMEFPGKHPANPGPFGTTSALDAPLPFLLVTTGVERLSGSVHGPMIDRWLAGEALVQDTMTRLKELGYEGAERLLAQDWRGLGALMDENHRLMADLGGSGEAIDHLIARCKFHGAISAKLAGAGLGGTVIALTEDPSGLQNRLEAEGFTRFMRPEAVEGVRYELGSN